MKRGEMLMLFLFLSCRLPTDVGDPLLCKYEVVYELANETRLHSMMGFLAVVSVPMKVHHFPTRYKIYYVLVI